MDVKKIKKFCPVCHNVFLELADIYCDNCGMRLQDVKSVASKYAHGELKIEIKEEV